MKRKGLKREVVSEFKGLIGHTVITIENMYCAVSYILDVLNAKFDYKEQEFVEDLASKLDYLERKSESYVDYTELESSSKHTIEESNRFEEIEFTYFGYTDWFEELNENIKNRKYTR